MKKFVFMFLGVALLMLAACGADSGEKDSANKTDASASKKISIVATIYPQYDWLKNVLGNRLDAFDLKLLLKNGTDLHSYKPSAQDIASIASADMVVFVGGESDEWIEKALEATPKQGRILVNLMAALGDRVKEEEVVEGMQVEEHEHHEHAEEHDHEHHEHADPSAHSGTLEHAEEHEHHEEVENDEHIWLSLKNAEVLVNRIAEELAKLDAENATIYKANASAYVAKLNELDEAYRVTVAGASHKTILFGDRFPFRYLVDDYGIKYYAAFVGCSAESEASFETVAFLAGKMDSLALPAIFAIDGSNQKIAKSILAASKNSKQAEVLILNSLQSVTDAQMKSGLNYLAVMQANLDVLKKALK